MSPHFSLPEGFDEFLEQRLQKLGYSIQKPEALSKAILKLSNLFIRGGNLADYWKENQNMAAYLAYFGVLNFIRAKYVFRESRRIGFLSDFDSIEEFGCGIGSATWAWVSEYGIMANIRVKGSDQCLSPLSEYEEWMKRFWKISVKTENAKISSLKDSKSEVAVLSYSLNETDDIPLPSLPTKKLVIIEPSTHQDGRRLLRWRDELIMDGWHAWAPCLHQLTCPLLAQSGKDWCHMRIHWEKPQWFSNLENYLPMKNNTLTMSYLLMSRQEAPDVKPGTARVIGDEQEEKGKNRQAICRGLNREFLSWLHRDQISLNLSRGDLIELGSYEQKANELRVFSKDHIKKLI